MVKAPAVRREALRGGWGIRGRCAGGAQRAAARRHAAATRGSKAAQIHVPTASARCSWRLLRCAAAALAEAEPAERDGARRAGRAAADGVVSRVQPAKFCARRSSARAARLPAPAQLKCEVRRRAFPAPGVGLVPPTSAWRLLRRLDRRVDCGITSARRAAPLEWRRRRVAARARAALRCRLDGVPRVSLRSAEALNDEHTCCSALRASAAAARGARALRLRVHGGGLLVCFCGQQGGGRERHGCGRHDALPAQLRGEAAAAARAVRVALRHSVVRLARRA